MSFAIGLRCPHTNSSTPCPCRTSTQSSSFFTACEHGDLASVVRSVLAKARWVDSSGYTALHYAAQNDKHEVVRVLLDSGALVDACECGATPLVRAAFAGALRTCELLIARGADVNAIDRSFGDLRTPLMKAASRGHLEVVRVLIEAGAERNATDAQQNTAWDLAADHRMRAMLGEIRGAEQGRRDVAGATAWDLAADQSTRVVAREILGEAHELAAICDVTASVLPALPVAECPKCKHLTSMLCKRMGDSTLVCWTCARQ